MTHPLAALLAGVPRWSMIEGTSGTFMARATSGEYLHVSEVLAALEAATPPDLVEAGKANIAGLLEASRELAGYASYAEIVGGVSVNRPQIRQWCDAVFEAVRTMPRDAESGEPTAPDLPALIALATAQAAQIAGLEAQAVAMRDAFLSIEHLTESDRIRGIARSARTAAITEADHE